MNNSIRSASNIYLDSNAIIYFVERNDDFEEKIRDLIREAVTNDIPIHVSEIAVAECLYGAYKLKSELLKDKYEEIFYKIGLFSLAPIDGDRVIAAARIGADHGLKLIDAIHFFAAMERKCDLFVTNDKNIRSSDAVRVISIKEL